MTRTISIVSLVALAALCFTLPADAGWADWKLP